MIRVVSLLALAGWTAAAIASDAPGGGEDSRIAAESPRASARFQRVFAPADRLQDWPFGKDRYLPVEPTEFEQLVKLIGDAAEGAVAHGAARLEAAVYEARLDADAVLSGKASLSIVGEGDAASLLAIDPLSPAIDDARWTASDEPATLGVDPEGRLVALVDRPDELQLTWSLAGKSDVSGSTAFVLEFPRCPRSTLVLDLPAGKRPSVDRGVATPDDEPADGRRRWRIELAGGGRTVLRLADGSADVDVPRMPLVRQTTTYQLWPHGVDVSVELKLDFRDAPRHEVQFLVDARCSVVAAQMGPTALAWSVAPADPSGDIPLTLYFPAAIQHGEHSLRLALVCPLTLDERWRLPTVRPLDALWQEGGIVVLAPEPLSLAALFAERCRQIQVGHLGSPLDGESHAFQCFAADAGVEVVVSSQGEQTTYVQGSTITLGETATARVVSDLSVADGALYDLSVGVAPDWIVEAVEAAPQEMLDEWQADVDGSTGQRLSMRFARPVTPERPLRLIISARRAEPIATGALPFSHLAPIDFPDAAPVRRLLLLRPDVDSELVLQTTGAAVVAQPDLLPEEVKLFETAEDGHFVDLDAASETDTVAVVRRPVAMRAAIHVDVEVSDRRLTETYTLRCLPEASSLVGVLVRFSQARPSPLRWTSTTDGGEPLPATLRVAPDLPDSSDEGAGPGGEFWDASLVRPRGGPTEISAVRSSPISDRMEISLADLPEVLRQQATVTLHARTRRPIHIDARSLRLLPQPPPRDGVPPGMLARYAYQPTPEAGDDAPRLVLTLADPEDALPGVVVWDAVLASHYGAGPGSIHTLRYRMENDGRDLIQLTFPSPVRIVQVTADGQPTPWRQSDDKLNVTLPDARRFVTLSLAYSADDGALGWWGDVRPPLPRIDAPVVSARWQCRLPPQYEMLRPSGPWTSSHGRTWTWSQRLLGPFGQSEPLVDGNLASAGVHSASQQVAASPWMSDPVEEQGGIPWRGGPVYELSGMADVWPSITVVSRSWWQLTSSAVFVLTVGLAWCGSRRYPRALLPLLGATAGVALLLPPLWAPLGAAAVLAVMACGLLRLLTRTTHRRTVPADNRHGDKDSTLRHLAVGPVSVGLRLLPVVLLATVAAQAAQNQSDAEPNLYRVFVPVDKQRQPTGEPYQVPEPLLRALREKAAAARQEPRAWIVRSATYRGSIESLPSDERIGTFRFELNLDLHVFDAGRPVRLPIERAYVSSQPGAVSLDGESVDVQWSPDDRRFTFAVPQAGEYRLQLQLEPTFANLGEENQLRLHGIAAAQARLFLDVSPAAMEIEVASARGHVARDRPRRRITADMGIGNVVTLRWPKEAEAPSRQPAEIEELFWMRIHPRAVTLDVRLSLPNGSETVKQLRLAADPQLVLRPNRQENQLPRLVEKISTEGFQGFRFQLPPITGDQPAVVGASLEWADVSGVGQIRLPHIEPIGARSTRRLLAVSVDASLQSDSPTTGRWDLIEPAEFLAAWGESSEVPQYIFQLNDDGSQWSLATRPVARKVVGRQRLALGIGSRKHQVRFRASLSTTNGASFHHRIAAPPQLEVGDVSVLQDGAQRASRWARDGSGAITVFLKAPTTGQQELRIDGWLPGVEGRELRLPKLRLESGEVESHIVDVFRKPAVLVDLVEPRTDLATAGPADDQDLGRLVATLDLTEAGEPVNIRVAANRPRARAVETTSLRRDGTGWIAQFDYHLDVAEGVLDRLWIDLPAELAGAPVLDPPIPHREHPADEQGHRRLVIDPDGSIEGEFHFSVRAPVAPAPDDQLHIPRAKSTSFARSERLVIVPVQFQRSIARWETVGLAPVALPDGFSLASASGDSFQAYRATQSKFHAVLRCLDRPSGRPRVQLADHHVRLQSNGASHAMAVFDVDPVGIEQCMLRMPEGTRPLLITVEGIRATNVPRRDHHLPIQLVSSQAPQRIDVLYEYGGPLAINQAGQTALAGPALVGLPVEQSLWTISADVPIRRADSDQHAKLTAERQQWLRLKSIDGLMRDAAGWYTSAVGAMPNDLQAAALHSYSTWAGRSLAGYEMYVTLLGPSQPGAQRLADQAEARAMLDRQEQWAREVFHADDAWARLRGEAPPADPASTLWKRFAPGDEYVAHTSVTGVTNESVLGELGSKRDPTWGRFALAAVFFGSGLAGVTRWANPLVEYVSRHPSTAGVVVGIAWWLWFWPGLLGLLIIVASLLAPLWPLLRRPKSGESGSSVIRIRSRYS